MADVTGFQKSLHTIPSKSTTTINLGSPCNYFRITNAGSGKIYLGVGNIPTPQNHEMAIPGGTSKLYVDRFDREVVYLYNDSTEETYVIFTSFSAEFSPEVLAFGDSAQQDLSDITIATEITGFTMPLPTGNNKIGKVDIASMPELPSGGNKIGSVDIAQSTQLANILTQVTGSNTKLTNLKDYMEILGTINTNLLALAGGGEAVDYSATLATIISKLTTLGNYLDIFATQVESNKKFSEFSAAFADTCKLGIFMITNDGETNISVLEGWNSSNNALAILKPGETLTDLFLSYDTSRNLLIKPTTDGEEIKGRVIYA